MENILTYILQINLLLTIVYGGYYLLLKGLTFYQLNRVYLLVGSIYAVLYPFIDFKSWFRRVEPVTGAISLPALDWSMPEQQSATYLTLENALLAIVAIGATVLVLKFLMQLVSLLRIHFYSTSSNWKTYFFRDVVFPIVPFSFFNKVYLHKEQHQEVELYDIFEHEYIHVKGLHTVDILWFEMLLIGCWYNPFVWLMRKAVRQNLEFLTDHQVLNKGADRQAYQYSLLNVTKRGAAVGLGNQFNFKTLKKRIMMMNKKRSSKLELSKYAFLLPIMILAGASFTVSKAESTIETVVEKAQETKLINEPLSVKMKGEVGQLLKETIGTDIIKIDTSKADTLIIPASSEGTRFFIEDEGLPKHDSMFVYNQVNFVAKDAPYILVDGKEIKAESLKSLSPNDIESISILKKGQGKVAYGDKGKNGVMIITTKSNSIVKPLLQGKVEGVKVEKGSTTDNEVVAELKKYSQSNSKPLFVVDGVVKGTDQSVVSSMKPEEIESITVLKDKSATALYGEKGKDGVIMIETKKAAQKEVIVTGFKKESSPSDLKEVIAVGYANKPKLEGEIKTVVGREIANARSEVVDSKVIDQVTVMAISDKASTDTQPQPVNGMTEFRKWIGANYRYSQGAINAGAKGTVKVSFVVEKDGSLSEIKAVQDIGYGTGQAAVELLAKAPKWSPGTQNGKPVRVQYTVPINLDLSKK